MIQRIGTVKRVSRGAGLVLEIAFEPWARELEDGESIAVNGVCLTVARHNDTRFTADVLRETEERSTLGALVPGRRVNLERATRAGDALGGHVVQGHVDARGSVKSITPRGRDFRLAVKCPRVVAAQCVLKGSIAVDGVSLTITGLGEDWLSVDLIPSTLAKTVLGERRTGDMVNLESDVIGKYVAKHAAGLAEARARHSLTFDDLARAGFI